MESAKRRVPSVVPLVVGGVRYEAVRGAKSRGFQQNGGVIAAIEVASGKELWALVVYKTEYDPQEEQDVQDVYIVRLSLSKDAKSVVVDSEAKKTYHVNLADHTVLAK